MIQDPNVLLILQDLMQKLIMANAMAVWMPFERLFGRLYLPDASATATAWLFSGLLTVG